MKKPKQYRLTVRLDASNAAKVQLLRRHGINPSRVVNRWFEDMPKLQATGNVVTLPGQVEAL